MNIYQRLHAVMEEVEYLNRDQFIKTGVSGRTGEAKGYRVLTMEKVLTALRPSLLRHGIVIIPIKYELRRADEKLIGFDGKPRPNRITELDATYRIQNMDDPDDYVCATSCGQGVDLQDKGAGKAMTYAFKYLLTTLFALPSGDDPDKVGSAEYTDELLSSAVPEDLTEKDTPEERERLQRAIIGFLRGRGRPDGDANAIAMDLYESSFYDLTAEQLVDIKIKVATGKG